MHTDVDDSFPCSDTAMLPFATSRKPRGHAADPAAIAIHSFSYL